MGREGESCHDYTNQQKSKKEIIEDLFDRMKGITFVSKDGEEIQVSFSKDEAEETSDAETIKVESFIKQKQPLSAETHSNRNLPRTTNHK